METMFLPSIKHTVGKRTVTVCLTEGYKRKKHNPHGAVESV